MHAVWTYNNIIARVHDHIIAVSMMTSAHLITTVMVRWGYWTTDVALSNYLFNVTRSERQWCSCYSAVSIATNCSCSAYCANEFKDSLFPGSNNNAANISVNSIFMGENQNNDHETTIRWNSLKMIWIQRLSFGLHELVEYCCLVISHCTFSPFNSTSGIHVVHQINVIQSIYSLMVPDLPKVKC